VHFEQPLPSDLDGLSEGNVAPRNFSVLGYVLTRVHHFVALWLIRKAASG